MSKNAGKGSGRRPTHVSKEKLSSNWDTIFGKKKEAPVLTLVKQAQAKGNSLAVGLTCKFTNITDNSTADGVVGRISDITDSLVYFTTPHGTVIKMGIVQALQCLHPLTELELEFLKAMDEGSALLRDLNEIAYPSVKPV